MKLPDFAVRRKVTIMMTFLAILLFGIISVLRLPIDLFPEIELPSISIITFYPGAGTENVETKVTKVIEEAVAKLGENIQVSRFARFEVGR